MIGEGRVIAHYVLFVALFLMVPLIFGVTGSWNLVLNLEIAFVLAALVVPILLWLIDDKIPEWADVLRRRLK